MSQPLEPDDRFNGWLFTISYILIYIGAPVIYVGVAQAALLNKLGASAAVASLPASVYMAGQIAPLFASWLVPHRLERTVLVGANVVTAFLNTCVLLTLVLPLDADIRIGAVVLQGLLQGFSGSTSHVFMLGCLKRGTTEKGLAIALKRTFTFGPLFAVAGSLGAQYVLNNGFPFLPYPFDFAFLYAIAVPCSAGVALVSTRYRLRDLPEEPRPNLFRFIAGGIRAFAASRPLALAWVAYMLWYSSQGIVSNLSLYTREAMNRDPKELSGLTLAIRFGCKAAGGWLLGWLAVRHGLRAGVMAASGLLAAGALWAWLAPGSAYLAAFGFHGAGELGGAYFPNYVGTLSAPAEAARNLAIVTLATPASSFAPWLHGWLTDHHGFQASFAFGLFAALASLLLVALSGRRKSE
ncbi:MAG: hypothetical protein FJW40_14880 [Acidobacteria bacterium]|nr:hypothetical protein [Acidobacteriota bacterium]